MAHPPRQLPPPSAVSESVDSTIAYTGTICSGPVAGGLFSAETFLKKAVEEESGSGLWDFIMGFRASILVGLWRRLRT